MNCSTCGAVLTRIDQFCGACGSVVSVQRALSWDWRNCLRLAGVVLGTSAALAVLFGLTSRPSSAHLDWGFKTTLAWVVWVWESTFGARTVGSANLQGALSSAGIDFSGAASGTMALSAMPLTLTVITLTVAAISFRKYTRHSPNAASALLIGFGAAILTAFVLAMVSLAVSINAHDVSHLLRAGDGSSRLAPATRHWHLLQPHTSLSLSMSSLEALLFPTALLFAVFVAVTLTRTEWLPRRLHRGHDLWVMPILRGFGRLMVALVVSGLVVELITWIVRKETNWPHGVHTPPMTFHQWVTAFSGAIAYAGNAGLMSLGLGSGGTVDYRWAADVSSSGFGLSWPESTHSYGLSSLAQSNHLAAGIWAAALCTPVVLGYVAMSVARPEAHLRSAAIRLTSWTLSLLAIVPLLAAASRVSIHGSLTAEGVLVNASTTAAAHASASAGLETWPAGVWIACYTATLSVLVIGTFFGSRGRTTDSDGARASL